MNAYLAGLRSSPVKSLAELVQWNKDHADLEMPPGESKIRPISQQKTVADIVGILGKGNQSLLEAAAKQETSPEKVDEIRKFMHRTADTEGLATVFDKFGLDILLGPADSELYHYAGAAGYPAACLPLSRLDDRGRPFGLIAIARRGGEMQLIKTMSAWEKTFPARAVPDMNALPV